MFVYYSRPGTSFAPARRLLLKLVEYPHFWTKPKFGHGGLCLAHIMNSLIYSISVTIASMSVRCDAYNYTHTYIYIYTQSLYIYI